MDDVLELIIPRKLSSPNMVRGYHWRAWRRETVEWQMLIRGASTPAALNAWSVITGMERKLDKRGLFKFKEIRRKERRRVTVIREVPNARHFIRDDDNLRFATKPLNDALKRLGLVYDDSRHWMIQPDVEQRISDDGEQRTIVCIARIQHQEGTHAA
jgi:hypothetical protein